MAEIAISTKSLNVSRGRRVVLRAVDFVANRGEITVVLGPNGAGKSTLLKTIAGLLSYEGQVLIDGEPQQSLSRSERVRRLAYVPQRSLLSSAFSVQTVVGHGRYSFGGASGAGAKRVQQSMERVDIAHLAERPFTQLSEGEHRRVLLARALATEAKLILLDEPTSALDVAHALRFFNLLRELIKEGYTFVIVVHGLEDAIRFTDRAILLHEGQVACAGATSDVISPGPLRRVYGVEMIERSGFGFRLPGDDS